MKIEFNNRLKDLFKSKLTIKQKNVEDKKLVLDNKNKNINKNKSKKYISNIRKGNAKCKIVNVYESNDLESKEKKDVDCVDNIEDKLIKSKSSEGGSLTASQKRIRKGSISKDIKENISNVSLLKKYNEYKDNNEKKETFKEHIERKVKDEIKLKAYFNNFFKNKNNLAKGYYVLLFFMILLGVGSVVLAKKTYNLMSEENYEVFSNIDSYETYNKSDSGKESDSLSNDENDNLNLQSDKTSNNDTKGEYELKNTNERATSTTNNQKAKTSIVQVKPLEFTKPLDGEILKIYSPDKVVYSKTLELWKTHDGIDIKADEGEYVKAIERGIVEKIYEDSFYGVTIVIDHSQGYKSSYSNLAKDTLVKEKQTITKAQKIGKISNTAIGEIKDESHLHFMLFKDNNNVDPTSIFK